MIKIDMSDLENKEKKINMENSGFDEVKEKFGLITENKALETLLKECEERKKEREERKKERESAMLQMKARNLINYFRYSTTLLLDKDDQYNGYIKNLYEFERIILYFLI